MNTVVEDPTPLPPPMPAAAPQWAQKICANCGAPMHGPYCYACGQPEKGMIRQLASVMHDVLDTVFNIDSRVFRSLLPLYFRPGYLTLEYFAGRRVRYVTPFRLFFFLCIVAFFAIQVALNLGDEKFTWNHGGINGGDVETAQTVADVQRRTAAELAGIEKALNAPGMPAGTIESLTKARDKIQKRADDRLAYLKSRDEARAKGAKAPPDPNMEDVGGINLDGKTWNPAAHPLKVSWLPEFANAELNDMLVRAKENVDAAKKDPRRLIEAVFSRLPWTLGILMPLFAVLLKIVYIFKRRLYMEHLMVALHSHAFIFMSLLLLAILAMLKKWALASAPGAEWVISLLRDAVWIWLPIYLFLMQKRVYRQGWFFTTVKYFMIGFCYLFMVSFGLAGAFLASLALG